MAAVDPTEDPEPDSDGNVPAAGRSTLRILKQRGGPIDDSDDEDDDDNLMSLIEGADSDEEDDDEDDDDDDEPNGGPSDPAKTKKARQEAAIKKLIDATQAEDSDSDMEDDDGKPNGVAKSKGKHPATSDDESDEDDDSTDGLDLEQYVVCTLDTERVSLAFRSISLAHPLTPHRTTSRRSTSPLATTRKLSSLFRARMPSTSPATMSSTTTRRTAMMMMMTTIFRPIWKT